MRHYLFFISQNYSYAILRPLQDEILRRGDKVAWFLWGNEVNSRYLKADEHVLKDVNEVMQYAPDAVFVPGNVVPRFFPGLKVAVFHGFNSGKLNRRGQNDHFNIRQCFDLYCTQGPDTTIPFQKLAQTHGYFNVVETGWPTLDPLFQNPDTPRPKLIDGKRAILMCSTFSRNLTCAPHLFEQVCSLSKSGKWRWIIQFHPKMPKTTVDMYKGLQGEHLTFVETDNILPLLREADVMLCDTSSVIQMFLVQNKPVVTFKNIDAKPYFVDFDVASELEQRLEYALSQPTELMEQIKQYITDLHPYSDGKSSERVLDAVELELAGLAPKRKTKPLNLLRNFKLRKKLGYWKI